MATPDRQLTGAPSIPGSGASGGVSSAGGSAGSPGAAGSGLIIAIPNTGGTGGVAGTGGISSHDAAGAAGYEPTLQTTGACILERIATRSAEGGAGGETSVPASTASGGEGGQFELGHGDLTLLVVFDKSGSMDSPWDERTKWQVANEALMKAIDPVIDNLTLGTIFFPVPGDCNVATLDSGEQVSFRTGREFRSYWQETAGLRAPNGSTPLEKSLRVADVAIEAGCRLGLLDDRFRVVLVTDGEPTCADDPTAIVELVADWNRAGVETWVMGLPGSEYAKQLLDAIALAGSTGKSQMLGTPGELDDGLAEAAK